MTAGYYDHSKNKNFRSSAFYQTEQGKKWINYDGVCSTNKEFKKEYTLWNWHNKKKYFRNEKKKYDPQEKVSCVCGKIVSRGNYITHTKQMVCGKIIEGIVKQLPPPPSFLLCDDQPKKYKFKIKNKNNKL